ncbi:hypothetical protein [Paenibacillus polymyxa]|uniref:hypothetical protein n=1 Tax=Paenibacillus polymyxa TaxID=1406 RepID=UPI002AB351CD|nr:hypothetical protein [Paenibacillus polymyxa]MDY8022041.1 hypothetical protein [Paenibacillus polymyxa]
MPICWKRKIGGEEGIEPAVVVFDMTSPEHRRVLPAIPSLNYEPSEDGTFPYPQADMASSGDRLFLWGKGVPLQVWRFSNGVREHVDTERYPLVYHHETGIFVELKEDGRCKAMIYK